MQFIWLICNVLPLWFSKKKNILKKTSKFISAHCDSVIALIYVGNSPRGSGDGRLYDVILVSGSLNDRLKIHKKNFLSKHMDQIKMADYSNFLSEADESNLQHEAIL